MSLAAEISDLQTELEQYREHVPLLKQSLDKALAEIGVLERRLDISERQRSINASRLGAALGALSNVGIIINRVIDDALQAGFKPEPVETVATPKPAAPAHGGGQADDGKEIPLFLTEKDLQEPKI